MEQIESVSKKSGGTAVLLAFAVIFCWFGLAHGAPALFGMVERWHQARSYVAMPASVLSVRLKINTGESPTESVQASFAYRYGDRDYVSDKVSSNILSDDFDSYHRTIHARLLEAKEARQPVTIWVDPAHPANALYDRSFRWAQAVFMLPFAVLFPAVGFGAWWGIWSVWWGKRDAGRHFKPGELKHPSFADRTAPFAVTFAAFFWNMICWPKAILLALQVPPARGFASYLIILFLLIGLGLAYGAAVMWRERWRIGKPMLELLQVPDGHHSTLGGRIHFSPALGTRLNPALQIHPVRITVKLQETTGTGDDATVSTLWENCALDTTLAHGAAGVNFNLELPCEMPSPSTLKSARRKWILELRALGTETDFDLPEAAPRGLG